MWRLHKEVKIFKSEGGRRCKFFLAKILLELTRRMLHYPSSSGDHSCKISYCPEQVFTNLKEFTIQRVFTGFFREIFRGFPQIHFPTIWSVNVFKGASHTCKNLVCCRIFGKNLTWKFSFTSNVNFSKTGKIIIR